MSTATIGPFRRVDGHSFTAALDPALFPESDGVDDPMRSCLVVSEDGVDLGPPHTSHQLIALHGGGAYSHWAGTLQFSSSDNTDPNENGRRYEVRWDADAYFARKARHALGIVRSWSQRLPDGLEAFRGKTVVEIGPGRDMGTLLALAALGAARVVGFDRFTGAWQADWHEPFIKALAGVLGEIEAPTDAGVLDRVLAARSFSAGQIEMISEPFERAGRRLGGGADVSVSHSVFEHFYSVPKAAAALASAMRPGARGVHNVDFRDHRNFGTPLEFLLVRDGAYRRPAANDRYGRGNRVRAGETREMLVRAGFKEVVFIPDQIADAGYLAALEERLRSAPSRFRGWRAEDLSVLSGSYVLTR